MASGATVTIKDTGWTLVADLRSIDGDEIQAGVLEGTGETHEGISTASLALIHEDGAPHANIPARPFVRPTFDQNVGKYEARIEGIVSDLARGRAIDAKLVALADDVAADQRKTITDRKAGEPIKPVSSVARSLRRLGDTPLVDSGALLDSLQGQVVKSGVLDGR